MPWNSPRLARHRPDVEAARQSVEASARRASLAWWELLGPELYTELRKTYIGDQVYELRDQVNFGVFVVWTFSFAKVDRVHEFQAQERCARL